MVFINAKRIRILRLCLNIATTVMCITAGICLIASCVDIYMSGNSGFSPDAVAQRFDVIDVPIYVCLAVIAVGVLFNLVYPKQTAKQKAERYGVAYVNSLYAKADLANCDIGLAYVDKTAHKKRVLLNAVTVILLAIGTVLFCSYALNDANYDSADVNTSVIKATVAGIISLAPAFVFACIAAYLLRPLRVTEGEALKKIVSAGNCVSCDGKTSEKVVLIVQIVCVALAAVLILYGLVYGGSDAVLAKAVMLCMECVGLG